MHLHFADTESGTVEVKDHIIVLGQQRHRNGTVGDLLGDHKGGQTHTERIVVVTGVPDGDTVAHPGFHRTDGEGTGGHILDGAAAGGTGILDQSDGMQFHVTGSQLTVFFGGGGLSLYLPSRFTGSLKAQCLVSP